MDELAPPIDEELIFSGEDLVLRPSLGGFDSAENYLAELDNYFESQLSTHFDGRDLVFSSNGSIEEPDTIISDSGAVVFLAGESATVYAGGGEVSDDIFLGSGSYTLESSDANANIWIDLQSIPESINLSGFVGSVSMKLFDDDVSNIDLYATTYDPLVGLLLNGGELVIPVTLGQSSSFELDLLSTTELSTFNLAVSTGDQEFALDEGDFSMSPEELTDLTGSDLDTNSSNDYLDLMGEQLFSDAPVVIREALADWSASQNSDGEDLIYNQEFNATTEFAGKMEDQFAELDKFTEVSFEDLTPSHNIWDGADDFLI